MFADKLQGKALKKMAAAILPNFLESPMMAQMVESVIAKIVEQKNKVELLPGEVEVCLLILERQGKFIVSAPVFDTSDRITRYVPLDGNIEAINLTDLIVKNLSLITSNDAKSQLQLNP